MNCKRFLTITTMIVLSASGWVGGSATGTDLFIPSLARTQGAQGSQWYTTVWIHNPNMEETQVTISFLKRNQSNPSPLQQSVTLYGGETLKLGDVFLDVFGLDEAVGALRFSSDQKIVVSARSYNMTGAGLADSQGQFIGGMPTDLSIGAGEQTSIPGITQPADGSFRCNFALVETQGFTAEIAVHLLNRRGAIQATRFYSLGPYQPIQQNLSHLGDNLFVDGGRLVVEVLSGKGEVLTFASMVGNGTISQDPSTLEMTYDLEQGTTADGDITAVIAGNGLSGGGSNGDVTLSIANEGVASNMLAAIAVTGQKIADDAVGTRQLADGAVSKETLAATGGTAGQILGTNGASLLWLDAGSGGDGDITSVIAGEGLSGGGSSGEVTLNIPADGITPQMIRARAISPGTHINPTGASGGDVIKFNGTGSVIWAADEGLSLPYNATTSDTNAVFTISNSDFGAVITGSNGSSGRGLYGISSSGIGVVGESHSSSGKGMWATNTSSGQRAELANGDNGVYGYGPSSSGAVYGRSTSSNGTGVRGVANSGALGKGVFGESTNGIGVYGLTSSGMSAWFVGGPAAVSSDLTVTGTLSKGGGSFKIDHPLDPENQFLSHSFVESPDMMNVYNGIAILDKNGRAVIELPEWFEALNRDFRYQLTCIGGFAPVFVAEKVRDNRFEIAGGSPDMEVSWQITGIRHDRWAETNRIPVEEVKRDTERGHYLHPEVWGAPSERSIDAVRLRAIGD